MMASRKTLRTYSLSLEAIDALDALSERISNGNKSQTIEHLIRAAAIENGDIELSHIGVPSKAWANDEGVLRCNPDMAKGVCPACYPEGVEYANVDDKRGGRYRVPYPIGWEWFGRDGRPLKRVIE